MNESVIKVDKILEENEEILQCLPAEFVNGILDAMKSQFNTVDGQQNLLSAQEESIRNQTVSTDKTKFTSEIQERVTTEAEEIVLTLKSDKRKGVKVAVDKEAPSCSKDGGDSDGSSPRVTRNKIKEKDSDILETRKQSNRRRSSREFSDSVVKNAIARKEQSFSQNEKVRRPSRPLKPTQKVLDNLAAASNKRGSKSKDKIPEETEIDSKKAPKRYRNASRNGKKIKLEESENDSLNSDNDSLLNLSKTSADKTDTAVVHTRRSSRISSAASRKEDDTPKSSPEKSNIPNAKLLPELLSASEQLILSRVCLCTTSTNIFLKKGKVSAYCEALDNIDGRVIGCSRMLNPKNVTALRPSLRIPYSLYCKMHTERLKAHNCCPTCGIFCTQGIFSECVSKHQYHTDCHMLIGEKICCPHCGLSIPTRNVKLTLECDQDVTNDDKFIPKQRRTISSDKPPSSNQHAPISSHVVDINDVTVTSANQITATDPINILSNIESPSQQKNADVSSKFHKLLSKMSNSSSFDVNMSPPSVINNPKKKMAARYKNPLEVSSVMNLIPIQNLEQQNDIEDDFEPSFDLYTISESILHEKYGQLRCLLDTSTPPSPIDLSQPFAYPSHLSPFSCSSPPSSSGDDNAPPAPTTILGTLLHYACALGRTPAVRMIVKKSCAPLDELKELLSLIDSEQNTPLAVALANGRNECARLLLDSGGCSIVVRGADGMSPLHVAARSGNLTGCELLLDHAARILLHSALSYLNSSDDGGWTALIWAAEHAHADVVALLLVRGADRMRRDVEHNMAVHWACYAGHVGVLNVLLESEATEEELEGGWMLEMVNGVNIQGDTPLHLAAHQSHTACITQLLAHGAEPGLLNKMHETPLDLINDAESDGYRTITKYLQQYSVITKAPGADTAERRGNIGDGVDGVAVSGSNGSANGGGVLKRRWRKQVLLSNDISRGRESNPIQIMNTIDTTSEPLDYTYITSCCLTTENVRIDTRITSLRHCVCNATSIVSCLTYLSEDGRSDVSVVECGCLDDKVVWYNTDGRLVNGFNFQDPPSIFECNDLCSCNSLTCGNRVVQKNGSLMNGSIRTQVFRTKNRGWALRTLRNIAQGSYVCEYVGEVLNDRDVNLRPDDSYVFDLDSTDSELYCIDAKFYGNMSRFINHSCQPNLVPVKVFTNHQDLRFPRIAFFANQNIRANDELSFDYGDKFWIIKYKTFTCECATEKCKYSKDTIATTLEQYCKSALATMANCNGH